MTQPRILVVIVSLFVFMLLAGCSSNVEEPMTVVPFFPDRHGWDLKQFSISDGNTSLDFKRVDCVWVVGHDNRPSDEPRVTVLAETLVTLAPELEPAIGPDRFRDFKVGDDSFTRKVVLTFKDNSSYSLLIGSPALTKPAYVRHVDTNPVYIADEPMLKQIDLDTGSWLAPKEDQEK